MAGHPYTNDYHSSEGAGGQTSAPHIVSVLVNYFLLPEYLDQIRAVDSRLEIIALNNARSAQAKSDNPDDWRKLDDATLREALSRAEIIFGMGLPREWIRQTPELEWVQLASAGSDHVLRDGLLAQRPDVKLTTASGIHEVPISEHILAMILFFSRGFNEAVHNQEHHNWQRYTAGEAQGKTVTLVGYGPIARRTALLCKALGMKPLVVRASIKAQQPGDGTVDRFYPNADLNSVLSQSDYVVLAAPSTPRTQGLIGKEQLKAMKKEAVLVNISRGVLVDEAALIKALQEGEIGGAALDVFAEEPLPESSPLWDMPDVLITPHVSGTNPYYSRRVTDLFCDNLRRYLHGEPLRNLVERERGY
ncbi:MAG: D-2-hydroxyacid dehydrogenase [Chloroflexi bacterium]|nr:D-2-hydroxyacid dehydrogenase [Chloroflexota bacterium]